MHFSDCANAIRINRKNKTFRKCIIIEATWHHLDREQDMSTECKEELWGKLDISYHKDTSENTAYPRDFMMYKVQIEVILNT